MGRLKFVFLKVILILLGITIFLNGVIMSFITNMNTGYILTILLGLIILLYGIFFRRINEGLHDLIKCILLLALLIVVCFSSFLFVYGSIDNVNYHEDAVVVLGAGLRGDTPTVTLLERLNVALEYYQKNPEAIIVVSGGQGPQETVTEAYAMEKYLISQGVPQEVIIKEDKSTSTYENFVYSKELLDELFDGEYNVAFVTNEYHVYRAGGISKLAGIDNVTHVHSSTRWYSVLPGTLRECLAVAKFWIFKV